VQQNGILIIRRVRVVIGTLPLQFFVTVPLPLKLNRTDSQHRQHYEAVSTNSVFLCLSTTFSNIEQFLIAVGFDER
jgi:hypothetical protein